MVQRDAYQCKDSENMLFWNGLVLKVVDKVCKTLVTLFHYEAWKVILILHKVNDSHYHWMIDRS
jgi:hypothetical protein